MENIFLHGRFAAFILTITAISLVVMGYIITSKVDAIVKLMEAFYPFFWTGLTIFVVGKSVKYGKETLIKIKENGNNIVKKKKLSDKAEDNE